MEEQLAALGQRADKLLLDVQQWVADGHPTRAQLSILRDAFPPFLRYFSAIIPEQETAECPKSPST